MTPASLAAIRGRHRRNVSTCCTCPQRWPCDAAELLVEVERLTTALETHHDDHHASVLACVAEIEAGFERREVDSIILATKAVGCVWIENEDGAEVCANKRAEQAEARLAALEGALQTYGRHRSGCHGLVGPYADCLACLPAVVAVRHCSCGLDAALGAAG